jgi:hypothetical protein
VGLPVEQLAARFGANAGLFSDCTGHDIEWRPPPGATWTVGASGPTGPTVEWTAELRALFIETYVNSGDIAEARDRVGVTPSQLNRELESNADFTAAVAEARPKATAALRERAIQMALAGNDKLLPLVLKAEYPEFRDNLKIDLKSEATVRLSDEVLAQQIERLQRRLGAVVDGEFSEAQGPRAALRAPARAGTPVEAPEVDPLLL